MNILSVSNLNLSILGHNILKDVSLTVRKGEIVGLAGESGSGKSMTAKAIMGLLPENSTVSGKVIFETKNLLDLNEKKIRKIDQKIKKIKAEIRNLDDDDVSDKNKIVSYQRITRAS